MPGDGLTPEQRWALLQSFGRVEHAIDEAIKRSTEVEELWQSRYEWPPGSQFFEFFWGSALPVLGINGVTKESAKGQFGGRPEGLVPVPIETFWVIFAAAVEDGAGARALQKLTEENNELAFVNRNKAGILVQWVADHPHDAKAKLDRHEIPRGFRVTADGVIFPTAKKKP